MCLRLKLFFHERKQVIDFSQLKNKIIISFPLDLVVRRQSYKHTECSYFISKLK